MKLDENLAAVHAYLCADGYVIKNSEAQKQKYYMIGFRNTNLILLKDFQDKFEKVFGVKPYLIEGQRCRLGSKQIYDRLTKEFGSFYSWEWKMPKLNKKLSKIWLRAYFDCEGWITCKSHQNRCIGADCVNEIGINQIREALEKVGIKSKVKKRNTRNIFSIFIFGRENLMGFNEKIGFLHPLKKEKLNEVMDDFVDYEWEYPAEKKELAVFIDDILKSKGKIKKNRGIIRIISNKEINLIRLQKELNRLFEIDSNINKRTNGIGTIYFELSINKQKQVKYLIEKNLINEKEKEKWLRLRK